MQLSTVLAALAVGLPALTSAAALRPTLLPLQERDNSNDPPKESESDFTEHNQNMMSQTNGSACRYYYNDWIPHQPVRGNDGMDMCTMCGNVTQDTENHQYVSCSLDTKEWQDTTTPLMLDPDGNGWAPGFCTCLPPMIDQIIDDVIESLPAIAEIGCEIMFDSLDKVLELGELAIPEAGPELDAGTKAAITAVKTMDKNGQKASNFLQWLVQPCGCSNYTDMIDNIFDTYLSVPDSVQSGNGKGKKAS